MKNSIEYTTLERTLKEKLFDQDFAIEAVTKTLLQNAIFTPKRALKAIFTFIGAPNSGKHYLGELLALHVKELQDVKTFYMDQYGGFSTPFDASSSESFIKEVLAYVTTHPNSVIIFEDIEKADLQIQLMLYTLLNDYAKGDVDFSNTVIIFTTTTLASLLQRKDIQNLLIQEPMQAHTFLVEKLAAEQVRIGDNIEMAFDKKLLSLINEHTLVTFNPLSLNTLINIATIALDNMRKSFAKQSDVTLTFKRYDTFVTLLTLSLIPYLNARHIKQKIPKLMFELVYDALKTDNESKTITFSVSKKALIFAQDIVDNPERFIANTTKKHQILKLDYSYKVTKKGITCNIVKAYYAKERLHVDNGDALEVSTLSFDDVAGHKKVKEELLEVVSLLKEPTRLQAFALKMPKGMFLYGPQGMGKKLLARAFAHEANMPYITLSGSTLFDTNAIAQAYAKAYSSAPAIIIFEDIDVQGIIGGMISTMSVEPIIAELDALTQSFESPIFTILTLSSGEIPPELLQADRIDIHIEVPKLDMDARRFFVKKILEKPHDESIDIEKIVRYISGMGGNELQRIAQESSLYAARKGLKRLTEEILLEQINTIKYGHKLENKQIRDIETSMAKTAYHEAGHAVLSHFLLPNVKIEQVTVAPRSETLGFVSYHNDDYIDATSKKDIFNDICVLLAGRIAKMHKYGDDGMETGAVNDLEVAMQQVYAAIAYFGMDEELGYINVSGLDMGNGNVVLKEKIEARLLSWIEEATQSTQKAVTHYWSAIEAVAQALIEKEVIDGEELQQIIKNTQVTKR